MKLEIIAPCGGQVNIEASAITPYSKLIFDLVEDSTDELETLHLLDVPYTVLVEICRWCTYHENNPPLMFDRPLKKGSLETIIGDWDASFLNVPQAMLNEYIKAGSYMLMDSFCEQCWAKNALVIIDQAPDLIASTFNFVNDLTKEEEQFLEYK